LICSSDLILDKSYNASVRNTIHNRLLQAGVHIKTGHRAVLAPNAETVGVTASAEPLSFSTGQEEVAADLVFWTLGKVTPNSSFVPSEWLNAAGYVVVDQYLRVKGTDNVFAVGDVADTDEIKSSARNDGKTIAAHNIRACLQGQGQGRMKSYTPVHSRWGSILGTWDGEGLEMFLPTAVPGIDLHRVWLPQWVWVLLWPSFQRLLWGPNRLVCDWSTQRVSDVVRRRQAENAAARRNTLILTLLVAGMVLFWLYA
jgi:NADH dehydrogenase FAD-containing subunit